MLGRHPSRGGPAFQGGPPTGWRGGESRVRSTIYRSSTGPKWLQADGVEAAVDVEGFAGHAARQVAQEVDGRLADLVAVDVALQGGFLCRVLEHLVDPADRHRRQGLHRAGAEAVDADLLSAQVE